MVAHPHKKKYHVGIFSLRVFLEQNSEQNIIPVPPNKLQYIQINPINSNKSNKIPKRINFLKINSSKVSKNAISMELIDIFTKKAWKVLSKPKMMTWPEKCILEPVISIRTYISFSNSFT